MAMIIQTGCTQPSAHVKFINSFPVIRSKSVMQFGLMVQNGPKMTKQESISFVYLNDSMKLYCNQKVINMETEKVVGISTELYFPQKCFQIKTSKFTVIGFSSYDCQDPNKLLKQFLTLNIIDALTYKVTDSLIVYKGNDYGWDINGLINTQTNMIFLIEKLGKRTSNARAIVYKINDGLKFEIENQQGNVKGMNDNLDKDLELLGWKNAFLN